MPVTVPQQAPSLLQPPYLRTGEVAALLGVAPENVVRWAKRGRLPFVRTPDGHRYPQAAVEALVQELGAALSVNALVLVRRSSRLSTRSAWERRRAKGKTTAGAESLGMRPAGRAAGAD